MIRGVERAVVARYVLPWNSGLSVALIAAFSLIGITLGVAVLIVVMSVMNGFRVELVSKIIGVNGHAVVTGYRGLIEDYDAVAARLETVDGVVRAIPFIEAQAAVTRRTGDGAFALIRGLTPEGLAKTAVEEATIVEGALANYGGDNVILGSGLAAKLRARVGDEVTLVLPQGRPTPFGVTPRLKSFIVGAIVEVGLLQFDEALLVMPLDTAQSFFGREDTVSHVEVFLDDPDRVELLYPALLEAANRAERVGPVTTWRQMHGSLVTALDVERNVMFLILTLIILIAAFNIVTSLIILVKNKSRDVAILRTMGLSRAAVLRIFIGCGAIIGVTGTILGFVAGIVFTRNIQAIQGVIEAVTGTSLWDAEVRYLTEIPAVIEPGQVIAVMVTGLIISLLATLPASLWASWLDPVKVLRYQ
ncbi:MAG: lipoprotein-releasing ABC transporter permease subunit [Rhodothalassiaceae bacterium]